MFSEFWAASELWRGGVFAMLGLVAMSAFFSSSETALFFLSPEDADRFRSGRRSERIAANLLADPDRLLTAILLWNLLINLSYFAVSVVVAGRLGREGLTGAAVCFSLFSLTAIILFGEVFPKSFAVAMPARLGRLVATPLAAAVRLVGPTLPVFGRIAAWCRKVLYPKLPTEPVLSQDDLVWTVEQMAKRRKVTESERVVLRKLLNLSEVSVEELMWPREDVVLFSPPVSRADLTGRLPNGGYLLVGDPESQVVTHGVSLLDLPAFPETNVEGLADPVVFVPWCQPVARCVQTLRESSASVACVVDEYGDWIGVVTEDDLMREVLVEMPSRAQRVLNREPIIPLGGGTYHVETLTTLRYFCARFDIEYEAEADAPRTVGGMLSDELGRLPDVGDQLDWQGVHIRVISIDDRHEGRIWVLVPWHKQAEAEQRAAEESALLEDNDSDDTSPPEAE